MRRSLKNADRFSSSTSRQAPVWAACKAEGYHARYCRQGDLTLCDAVEFARENQLLVAVRCGGHSPIGHSVCDGGIVIDLSGLKNLEIVNAPDELAVSFGIRLADRRPAGFRIFAPVRVEHACRDSRAVRVGRRNDGGDEIGEAT